MKRIVCAVLAVSMLLLTSAFVSCGEGGEAVTYTSLAELVAHYVEKYELTGGTSYAGNGTEGGMTELERYSVYGVGGEVPDFSSVGEYAVYLDSALDRDTEIGVFRMKNASDGEAFLNVLKGRTAYLIPYLKNYSVDTSALENAVFGQVGSTVYYAVVKDRADEIAASLRASLK